MILVVYNENSTDLVAVICIYNGLLAFCQLYILEPLWNYRFPNNLTAYHYHLHYANKSIWKFIKGWQLQGFLKETVYTGGKEAM